MRGALTFAPRDINRVGMTATATRKVLRRACQKRLAAALGACLQVDVVKAHGVVRRDLELGHANSRELLIDAVGEERSRRFE